jgi:hypothetical protein
MDALGGGRSAGRSRHGTVNWLLEHPVWTDEDLADAGVRVTDSPFVTVGGGLASFALVDVLRIAGVPADHLRVIGPNALPHDNYRYLCESSGLMPDDRLRSDSGSRIDNIWGWPSYALEEAWRERSLRPLWQVLTEPILSEYYTPRTRDVYAGVEREARRIGWDGMRQHGCVSVVRRRRSGGYFVLLDGVSGPEAVRTGLVHLAIGYPALRFLPDLREFRSRYAGDVRFVHAYEPHAHVYRTLAERGGTVIVRGAGIAASRVLQRLADDRERTGAPIDIVHLFRRHVDAGSAGLVGRRRGGDGFTYQPFNFAKSAGGGQLHRRVRALEGAERAAYLRALSGTTTPARRMWQRQLRRGRRGGWYRPVEGGLAQVRPETDGGLLASGWDADGGKLSIHADFVIDATGLDGDVSGHALLTDLLEHSGVRPGPLGRLDVSPRFEVRGTRSGAGRVYASGPLALGGYLGPVDSFWGLVYAAIAIADDLAEQGFCRRVGPVRSVRSWWRWMRGATP